MSAIATIFALLAPLVAFKPREVETRDENETYPWMSTSHCLMAQYRTAMKLDGVLAEIVGLDAYVKIGYHVPRTFGAALQRARAFRQSGAV